MAEANFKKTFTFYYEVEVPNNLMQFISDSEKVDFAVKTVRDVAIFTDKRILIIDKQGVLSKKVEYYSIPYKSIITYAVETAGTFDLDSEIKLFLSGGLEIELNFMKSKGMGDLLIKVYHLINDHVTI